jgi:hypothetical protein
MYVNRRQLGPSRKQPSVHLKRKLPGILVRVAPRELHRGRYRVERCQEVRFVNIVIDPDGGNSCICGYGRAE